MMDKYTNAAIQEFEESVFNTVDIDFHYPYNPEYYYELMLVRIDLDKEKEHDINTGNGFIITKSQNIRKDIKSDESIFSSKYGMTLQDINPFINRYKCKCGHYQGASYQGMTCEYCKTKVKYVSDNFEYFGGIVIRDEYCLIHPNLYKVLKCFIGNKNLELIINSDDKIDEDGYVIKPTPTKDNQFAGLGIVCLRDDIDEVLEYYRAKNPSKLAYYMDLKENKEKLFVHSIPVYTTQLRPYSIDDNCFNFEGNNATFNLLAGHAARVNKGHLYIRHKDKPQKQILYAMQTKFNEIYTDMEKVLAQKKGYVRSLIGGRFNFCSRVVIVPEPSLGIDQLKLPYASLIEIFEQRIINILSKTYMPYEAYEIWDSARNSVNKNIANLIQSILETEYVGVLFGRNPSIATPSICQMRVVGINYDYSCSVPLQILKGLAADFDGDTLNVFWIINNAMLKQAMRVFNPRYARQISSNDGMFNSNVAHQTDTMICLNSFAFMARDSYSNTQLEKIRRAKASRVVIESTTKAV